ncbi:RNA 2',3'-cyclic phosphodiesterase [Caldimonas thermodepolymerans]|nr:RNA 2',3'-cyclic phosphodiesterase [Caldimonas thermodepolymerans]QPC30568.1 RNA 2',3'-cyclic phosphodiesterase [Caldimonas thermodepolymerans]RDI02836.1 2'-5' RNA ligase [Caldimonas thermodepolymerans]UZG43295.1 RNA 2',3'-cyclic phosphodiesterase [Caldimonas thermodepolymerans]
MSARPAPPFARLFFALWPDAATRAEWVACQQDWAWPEGAHLTPQDQLHLTLHFLGRVPRDRLPALQQQAQVPFKPFELCLDRAGTWPSGIAWLQPSVLPEPLLALHRELGTLLQGQGFELEDRRYRPHVTLARNARAARAPAAVAIPWRVDGYVLVESHAGTGGGYEVLCRYGETIGA